MSENNALIIELKQKIVELERELSLKKEAEHHLSIQFKIEKILAESANLMEVTEKFLQLLCELYSFEIGEIWAIDEVENLLKCVSIYIPSDKESSENYRLQRQKMTFMKGHGFAGFIWSNNKVHFFENINNEPLFKQFPVASLTRDMNLKGAVGIPIFFEEHILGVILFLTEKPLKLFDAEQKLFVDIGNQIGTYISHKRAKEELLYLANHDMLTGLANRPAFIHELHEYLVKNQEKLTPAAVLYCDLDDFKTINDNLGFSIGDRLLQAITRRLKSSLRTKEMLARLNNDEFALLLTDIKHESSPAIVANRILNLFKEPFIIDGKEITITLSIGVSVSPHDGTSPHDLLINAENAKNEAKALGKNNFQFCSTEMTTKTKLKMLLESDFRNAIEKNEFLLLFQPRLSLKTKKIVAIEALMRWEHPKKGLILPIEFIPAAIDANLIQPLGEWFLKEALKQSKKWIQNGFHLPVSLPITAQQFKQSNLLERIEAILKDNNFMPHFLELEIPEAVLMEDISRSFMLLRALKESNIHLTINEFGTGYSSFSHLQRLSVDNLKIDHSFIDDIENNKQNLSIVKAIITMAHQLNVKAIAEGIENKEQLDLLEKSHCDEIQGFYFNDPLDEIALQELLEKEKSHPIIKPAMHLSIVPKNPKK